MGNNTLDNILVKNFQGLTVSELYDVLQARNEVFVVEQKCIYQDADDYDQKSLHVIVYQDDKLAAYCRVLPAGLKYKEWSIGRVLTMPQARGKGVGHVLIKAAIAAIQSNGGKDIRISAQSYLKRLYEGYGFVAVGNEYLEDDIPHIEMLKN